jgi:hypothetical protein
MLGDYVVICVVSFIGAVMTTGALDGAEEHGQGKFSQETFEDTDTGTEEFDEPNDQADFGRIDYQNRQKLKLIDGYINKLWSRRVLMSTLINICLVLSALYNGTVFVYAVIFTCLFHILDKHLDFGIHRLYQAKDYAKHG